MTHGFEARRNAIILALILTGCSADTVTPAGVSYWDYHPWFALLGWVFFPRIMFWFFSVISGGFFFWVGVDWCC